MLMNEKAAVTWISEEHDIDQPVAQVGASVSSSLTMQPYANFQLMRQPARWTVNDPRVTLMAAGVQQIYKIWWFYSKVAPLAAYFLPYFKYQSRSSYDK